jgi:hypothetical protein
MKVFFSCSCDDPVGRLYATAFRDILASSPRFIETTQDEEKGADGKISQFNWSIRAVSVDPTDNDSGYSTAISVAFVLGNTYYITNTIQTCGRTHAQDAARGTLSFLDANIQKFLGK